MKRITNLFVLAAVLVAGSMTLVTPPAARADLVISVRIAPPILPVYSQPPCPAPGYLWTPGYWAWSLMDGAYYWVPGTWVLPPQVGYLWTPGYWAWDDGAYYWHRGYWAQQVGFYGGIVYGFGYPGSGFYGGYWRGPRYYYNRTVNNVNVTVVRNVYVRKVVVVHEVNRISYNGGHGGVQARPRHERYVHGPRLRAVAAQRQQREWAQRDHRQFYGGTHARPAVYATSRPGAFQDRHALRQSVQPPAHHEDRGQRRQVSLPAPHVAKPLLRPEIHRPPVRHAPVAGVPEQLRQAPQPVRRLPLATPQRAVQQRAEQRAERRVVQHQQPGRHPQFQRPQFQRPQPAPRMRHAPPHPPARPQAVFRRPPQMHRPPPPHPAPHRPPPHPEHRR